MKKIKITDEALKVVRNSNNGHEFIRKENPKYIGIDEKFIVNDSIPEYKLNLLRNFNESINYEYQHITKFVTKIRALQSQTIEDILKLNEVNHVKPSLKKEKEQKLEKLYNDYTIITESLDDYKKIEKSLENIISIYSKFIIMSIYHNNKFSLSPKKSIDESFEETMKKINKEYDKLNVNPIFIETVNKLENHDSSSNSLIWLNSLVTKKEIINKAKIKVEKVEKDNELIK